MPDEPKPKVNLRFLYAFCNEMAPTRAFYTDLLSMSEISFMDQEQFGWLAYQCEGMQLMFFRADEKLPTDTPWADQPGEMLEGAKPMMSFSLEFSEDDFRQVVAKVREAKTPTAKPDPTWRQSSYWGWTVKDPMGNTIELYATPKQAPEGDKPEWQD